MAVGDLRSPKRFRRLAQLEAEGLSAAKIAAKLGTTRGSVISRSQRLRGLHRTFPSFLQQEREARARSAARQKERKRKMDAVLSKLRQEIARGIARNEAIIRARKAGATLQAIGRRGGSHAGMGSADFNRPMTNGSRRHYKKPSYFSGGSTS